ncbi:MAG: hypothetical protein ISP86_02710 [Shewanellaceae bacterium]|nr:hypothetical protein [Shewanellaceae bacterium]
MSASFRNSRGYTILRQFQSGIIWVAALFSLYLAPAIRAQERLALVLPQWLPALPRPLSYEAAVERIEWAYRCGYVAASQLRSAATVLRDVYEQGDGRLYRQVIYPTFTIRPSVFDAPTQRMASCAEPNPHQMLGVAVSKMARSCELQRHQAYLEGYITEATYLALKQRHLAPLDREHSGEIFCFP